MLSRTEVDMEEIPLKIYHAGCLMRLFSGLQRDVETGGFGNAANRFKPGRDVRGGGRDTRWNLRVKNLNYLK